MDKFELLCLLEAISNYAYDIHYTANGRFFFSDHLFSERLSDVDVKDDFIETFYLGKSQEAPASADIARKVADLTPEITENEQDNFKRLRNMIIRALMGIQGYDGTKGEEDLLGSVAHILQRHNGLLYRQLTYTPEEIRNDDDDWGDIVDEEDTTQTLENEKWITVHPNKENPDDYRRLKVEDGETSKEAVERKFGKDDKKADKDKKEPERMKVNPYKEYKDFMKFHGWSDGEVSKNDFDEIKKIVKKHEGDLDEIEKDKDSQKYDSETFMDVLDYVLDFEDDIHVSDIIKEDKQLKSFEKEIMELKHEDVAVFDKNGEKILYFNGGKHHIAVTEKDLKKMENGIFTHNHPSGNIFSDADLYTGFTKTKLAELRAVTPNGTVYSLKPLKNASISKLLVEYRQTENRAERLFREKLDRDFRSGIITAEERKKALYNDFNEYCNNKLITMFKDKSEDFGFEFKEYKEND